MNTPPHPDAAASTFCPQAKYCLPLLTNAAAVLTIAATLLALPGQWLPHYPWALALFPLFGAAKLVAVALLTRRELARREGLRALPAPPEPTTSDPVEAYWEAKIRCAFPAARLHEVSAARALGLWYLQFSLDGSTYRLGRAGHVSWARSSDRYFRHDAHAAAMEARLQATRLPAPLPSSPPPARSAPDCWI